VKHAGKLGLLAEEETLLQGVIEGLIETEICYGMEISVKKAKLMRISRHPSPIQIMINQKQPENVEYIDFLGIMKANDVRGTREIK
jgi:hypothetical protein